MSPPLLIAIVDDDPDVRGSLDSLLRSAGHTGVAFESAEHFLASAAIDSLACIVTDLHMPGMTGLQLQAELARREVGPPVIVMTAYPTDAARDQAARTGALAFLVKPVDPDELLDAIERGVAG